MIHLLELLVLVRAINLSAMEMLVLQKLTIQLQIIVTVLCRLLPLTLIGDKKLQLLYFGLHQQLVLVVFVSGLYRCIVCVYLTLDLCNHIHLIIYIIYNSFNCKIKHHTE